MLLVLTTPVASELVDHWVSYAILEDCEDWVCIFAVRRRECLQDVEGMDNMCGFPGVIRAQIRAKLASRDR